MPTTLISGQPHDWLDVEEYPGTDAQKLSAAAFDSAVMGKIMRWKRGKTYTLPSTLDLSPALAMGKLQMETEGAEILKTAAVYAMRADGVESAKINLSVNAPQGSFTVALPAGQGLAGAWAKGDIFAIESTLDVFGPDIGAVVKYVRARELQEVYKVTGDTLTLDGPLIWAYTTAAGARYSKIAPGGQLIIRGGLQIRASVAANEGYALFLNRLRDPLTDDISTLDHGGGLYHRECLGGTAMRYEARRNPSSTNPWYYNHVFGGACMGTRLIGYTVRGGESESSCTTLSDERTPVVGGGIDDTDPDSPNGDTYWGGPIGCTIADGDVQLGSLGTCYGSHSAGLNNTLENCKGRGGQINFSLRDIGRKLIGATGRGSSARAISGTTSAEDAQIIGGEFSWSTTEGAALSAPRTRVVGAYFHDLGTVGLNISGDDSEILDTTVLEAGTIGPANYAIQCSGGNRKRIAGCNLPKGVHQAVAVLNAGATDRVIDNDCYGYGSGNPFITPTLGAIIQNNRIDQVRGIASASTITPLHDGPLNVTGVAQIDNIATAGWAGRTLTLLFSTTITLAHFSGGTGNLRLAGSVNFVATANDNITLLCSGGLWFEIGRTVI